MAGKGSTVAILGAGPSGLTACKAALEEGLSPVVFERAAGVGGLWRSDGSGKVWNSLKTNLSKFTCAFSDAPWPEAAPDFPNSADVQNYLESYSSSISSHIRLNTVVVSVEPTERGGWQICFRDACNPEKTDVAEIFDYVIVATGIFSKPHQAAVPDVEHFSGKVLHASDYREPSSFSESRVLVVGSAFSGADIAADIAGHAKSVTIAARRPLWYLPRYIAGKPADLAFYSRAATDKDAVKEARVSVRPSAVSGFEGNTVVFADGHREEFDTVLIATGYRLDLPFFSSKVLEALEFDANDLLQPVILHECVWRPELPRLAFVGVYRGPYFAAMELQARWACGVFSGRLPEPSTDELAEGLEMERNIRNQSPRPQFPHGDYVAMAEALACRVGVQPHEILEDKTHALHSYLYDGPLLPFHYRLVGFGAKPEVAEGAINECATKYPLASL